MPKSNADYYDLSMAFVNHADQHVVVTSAEDGGAQIEIEDIRGSDKKLRVFLDAEEIERVIRMLAVIKDHITGVK